MSDPTSGAPSANAAIRGAVNRLENTIDRLQREIFALNADLAPVAMPESPEIFSEERLRVLHEERPPMSAHAKELDTLAIRLDGSVMEVHDLRDRLDLPA